MKRDILFVLLIVFAGVALRMWGGGTEPIPDSLKECFVDETGVPYLADTDSYLYLRYAEAIADGQNLWHTSRENDPLMTTSYKMKPGDENKASNVAFVGMSYLGAGAIVIARLFGYNNAAATVTFLNMLLASLVAVPAYIFVRRRTNSWGGIVAGMTSAFAVSFVSHTVYGFFDTDCILAVFPMMMMCFFTESLFANTLKKQIMYIAGAWLSFLMIAVSWGSYTGYYFIMFGVCLVLVIASLLFPYRFPRKNIKTVAISFGVITLTALIISGGSLLSGVFRILTAYTPDDAVTPVVQTAQNITANSTVNTTRPLVSDIILNGGNTGTATDRFPSATLFTAELAGIELISGGWGGTFNVVNYGIINRLGGFGLVFSVVLIMIAGIIITLIAVKRPEEKTYSLAEVGNWKRGSLKIRRINAEKKKREIELTGTLRNEWAVELATFGVWLLGTLIMLVRGVRFIELPALPLSVVFGLGIGYLTKSIKDNNIDKLAAQFLYLACGFVIFGSVLQLNTTWAAILGAFIIIFGILARNKTNLLLVLLVSASMLISPIVGTVNIAKGSIPTVTDAFADASEWIKENTDEKSVLASWWDYGYYFEEAAQRRCIADGGTTNGEMFYYLAHGLMSHDPEESAKIFRNLADYKGDNDDLYLIISRDMLEKIGAIGYYGTFDMSTQNGESGYFYSTLQSVEVKKGESISVGFPTLGGYGVNYTITEEDILNVSFISESGKVEDISRLTVIEDGEIVYDKEQKHEYDKAPELIVVSEKGRYSAALCSQGVSQSMMVRLYLSNGKSISNFERVNVSTLDAEAVGESSEVQRLLGNYFINGASTTGVVVYKIK